MRALLVGVGVLTAAGGAAAQYPYPGAPGQGFPGQGYGSGPGYGYGGTPFGAPGVGGGGAPAVLPNFYNPMTQPLSPYLNLLRGGNAGVNYYYGVRPGTVGGGGGFYNGVPFYSAGATRPPLFPQLAATPGPADLMSTTPTEGYVLPPTGHPVMFQNTLGYYPGSGFGSPGRSGSTGLGTSRPQAPRR